MVSLPVPLPNKIDAAALIARFSFETAACGDPESHRTRERKA